MGCGASVSSKQGDFSVAVTMVFDYRGLNASNVTYHEDEIPVNKEDTLLNVYAALIEAYKYNILKFQPLNLQIIPAEHLPYIDMSPFWAIITRAGTLRPASLKHSVLLMSEGKKSSLVVTGTRVKSPQCKTLIFLSLYFRFPTRPNAMPSMKGNWIAQWTY
jgi:hypothetical protein